MRVYRNGRALGFWEAECQKLQTGDIVVEIVDYQWRDQGDGHDRDDLEKS